MVSARISTHRLFHKFICSKIDGVRRSCINNQYPRTSVISSNLEYIIPAPTTTLDSPLHSDMYPSTLEIVAIALPMPVYIAAGVGLTTCIRVYDAEVC